MLIADATTYLLPSERDHNFSRYAQTAADRLRIGYGRLTIYLGAAAGSGKTFAMLDRAHQLQDAGVDVVGAFIETQQTRGNRREVRGPDDPAATRGGVRRRRL